MNNINFLTIIPRNAESFKYFIDDDMTSAHSMRKDEIYLFICQRIKPPATIQALDFLNKHFAFIVNIQANTVERFEFYNLEEERKLREKAIIPRKGDAEKLRNIDGIDMEKNRERWHDNMIKKYGPELDKKREDKYNRNRDIGRRFL